MAIRHNTTYWIFHWDFYNSQSCYFERQFRCKRIGCENYIDDSRYKVKHREWDTNLLVSFFCMMYRTRELYDERNETKKWIHFQEHDQVSNIFLNEREIWYTKLGVNVGYEENGKRWFLRPVLVLRKVGNLFFVIALTSKWKEKNRFYHKLTDVVFNEKNKKYEHTSYGILSQVRVIDKKRFTEIMWRVSDDEFSRIKQKLKELLL